LSSDNIFNNVDFSALYDRLLKSAKVSQNQELAAELGVSPSVLSALKAVSRGIKRHKGVVNAPWRQIIEWALRKSVSLDWLLTGEEPTPPAPASAPEIRVMSNRRELSPQDYDDHYVAVPLLADAVAAGAPAAVREQDVVSWAIIYRDRTWMPHGPENYTCCRIRGNSMWPVLGEGDIVAVDHKARPMELSEIKRYDGKMMAFRVDGGVTIKWLKYMPEQMLVLGLPENKDALDYMVSLKEQEIDRGIIGKVAWWWAKR
jgi:phage repressor protein C with HTH and peptisase S24 domain